MLTEQEKLQHIINLEIYLSQVHDLDILMETILTESRRFTNADAGSIYIKEQNRLNFTYTQNDTLQNRLPKGEKLIYSTFSMEIDTRSIAGYVATTGKPLNIPDVYNIDAAAPYYFNKTFDLQTNYKTRSILTLPLKNPAGTVMGVLQVINPKDGNNRIISFCKNDETMMMSFASIAAVALERAGMTRALLLRMIRMAEMRDPQETGAHVNRVAGFSIELYERWARNRGISENEISKNRDVLRMAAMLHDAGKVAIPDIVLKKPGRFNPDEYEIMKKHTILGAGLFSDRQSDFDEAAMQVALNHHERWDGNGYPGHVDISGLPYPGKVNPDGTSMGKKEEDIPVFGRIVAVADVYDALSSVRVYKEAWPEDDVLSTIEKGSGTQFDPDIISAFFMSLDSLRSIRERYKDET
jgi:HD-GYP domain-containing protein (c-di-GMP phosphodiesterase class II)